MTMPQSQAATGIGSTSFVPAEDYWTSLAQQLPDHPVGELRVKSNTRQNAFRPSDLPPPPLAAEVLLDRVAADGWIVKQIRRECPNCEFELFEADVAALVCPNCEEEYADHDGVVETVVYVRDVTTRQVDWVVAIHGMNTRGAWQEEFSWYFGTTWGRSVPVSVYKYGKVITGLLLTWKRRKLQQKLRARLAALRDQAEGQGFTGRPDVIAHSFGTWLLGHVLLAELQRPEEERLRLGRLILAGCVLRPDFNWKAVKDAGLVDEVLCHYGTKDIVVPLAHFTIWHSGPSGRRGFDGDQVINVTAEGYGHSDLMSTDKCVIDGTHGQKCKAVNAERTTHLDHTYRTYWRPFLTRPATELAQLPDLQNPATPWRQAPWLLRGTILPILALPLLFFLVVLVIGLVGELLWEVAFIPGVIAMVGTAVLLALLLAILLILAWRAYEGRRAKAARTDR